MDKISGCAYHHAGHLGRQIFCRQILEIAKAMALFHDIFCKFECRFCKCPSASFWDIGWLAESCVKGESLGIGHSPFYESKPEMFYLVFDICGRVESIFQGNGDVFFYFKIKGVYQVFFGLENGGKAYLSQLLRRTQFSLSAYCRIRVLWKGWVRHQRSDLFLDIVLPYKKPTEWSVC